MKITTFILFTMFCSLVFMKAGICEEPDEVDYSSLFEDSDNNVSSDENRNIDLSINGDHVFKYRYFIEKKKRVTNFTSILGIESKTDHIKIISNWELDFIRDNDTDPQTEFRYLENSIKVNWSDYKFGIGYQEYTWGTGDEYNPSDNLNPKDYTKSIFPEKLHVFSVDIEYFPKDFLSIQFVYIPNNKDNIYLVDYEDQLKIQLPGVDIYTEDPDGSPFVVGGKLNFYLPDIDFSFGYIYDYDDFYTPEIELIENSLNPPGNGSVYDLKEIRLVKKRVHHLSADFKTIIDRFGFWGEFCYTITEDYQMDSNEIRNHRINSLLGFDYSYGTEAAHSLNFQIIGEYIPNFDDTYYKDYDNGYPDPDRLNEKDYMEDYYNRTFVNNLGSYTQELLLGGILNLNWSFNNSLVVADITSAYYYPFSHGLETIDTKKYGSLLLTPEIDIMPVDNFHIILGAELAYSWIKKSDDDNLKIDREDRYGIYNDQNHIYFKIQYKWDHLFKN